ncbi:hypothetical protein V1477_018713 [Vespula maculifrons]|uniref:Uncharacterized protein n=1 Tax=Vespula maculifrons TaxID=7453 RepID=A0ABD2AX16_VESMC
MIGNNGLTLHFQTIRIEAIGVTETATGTTTVTTAAAAAATTYFTKTEMFRISWLALLIVAPGIINHPLACIMASPFHCSNQENEEETAKRG